jgi:hypothetical protein
MKLSLLLYYVLGVIFLEIKRSDSLRGENIGKDELDFKWSSHM